MSTPINDGGPAFPAPRHPSEQQWKEGMSIRDYFAGHALTGLIAMQANPLVGNGADVPDFQKAKDCSLFANAAYALADAMLAARERKEPTT